MDLSAHPQPAEEASEQEGAEGALTGTEIIDLMLSVLSDGLDHPELWTQIPAFALLVPDFPQRLATRLDHERGERERLSLCLILAVTQAAAGMPHEMVAHLQPLAVGHSQSPLVQGALFHIHGLADPDNPKYRLEGKICPAPFVQLDVLERSTHQCCASWLQTSAGDLSVSDADAVWNSENAQAVRASVHDGSYRHCNKMACPKIQADDLAPAFEAARWSDAWRAIVEGALTALPTGPETVNLAYDRTCNLSCPSCRTEKWAADEETRVRFDEMQQRAILPLLKNARTVFVTGSGDPFASKNFRRLMTQLDAENYPDLRFQIMTNAMLFTPKQWEAFPTLHGRVKTMKISIDAATGPTHELLRRGARWPVMLENMAYAGKLRAAGLIEHVELVFTVQSENYREMGDAVTLMDQVGASGIYFARITNWGTFDDAGYARKAVFLPGHVEHGDFLTAMQDARLRRPEVILGDLHAFIDTPIEEHRSFAA
ncbi:MAG: radical SAM protein [Sphingomonadaceae bacterium]|nr:radical SAM protein [Sphingomonadaceae bacterium]